MIVGAGQTDGRTDKLRSQPRSKPSERNFIKLKTVPRSGAKSVVVFWAASLVSRDRARASAAAASCKVGRALFARLTPARLSCIPGAIRSGALFGRVFCFSLPSGLCWPERGAPLIKWPPHNKRPPSPSSSSSSSLAQLLSGKADASERTKAARLNFYLIAVRVERQWLSTATTTQTNPRRHLTHRRR